jgi:hypothetical protein
LLDEPPRQRVFRLQQSVLDDQVFVALVDDVADLVPVDRHYVGSVHLASL